MDKLELGDLVGYLPYGLKIKHGDSLKKMNTGQGSSKYWIGISAVIRWQNIKAGCKPVLRPLSDLVKEIEVDGHRIVPAEKIFPKEWSDFKRGGMRIDMMFPWNRLPKIWRYIDFVQLLELHFDVFGLIKRGLAVDINTI